MASPLRTGKQSVRLASDGPRMSRIRRDPPPPERKKPVLDREDRDRIDAAVGIVAFALAIAAIILAASIYGGWRPSQYSVQWQSSE